MSDFFLEVHQTLSFNNPTCQPGILQETEMKHQHAGSIHRDGKPDFLQEIPRSTATICIFLAGGGDTDLPLSGGIPGGRAGSSSEGHWQQHYTHDYPLDAGNRGLAACRTPVIQVMDLQHSLLKYQTQQFFTAFTLEFMAQGGDLRTRRGIIALFSS